MGEKRQGEALAMYEHNALFADAGALPTLFRSLMADAFSTGHSRSISWATAHRCSPHSLQATSIPQHSPAQLSYPRPPAPADWRGGPCRRRGCCP